ncbi:hypothetical protein K488DRAFT_60548 [Vararia minispora EC-137]|uniref:Uncharacterized protein n=1 Tax=Vararia minispora EC-137 TaxID=1314806 RepID=A0ACB8Q7Q3_9AGAM|nr:hypothetical protein K488DRAFT_60548 [Vararia minispora EC-137]
MQHALQLESALPPAYRLSGDTPVYSPEPGPREQRLATGSPISIENPSFTGLLRRSGNGITVFLKNQDEAAQVPSYGRHTSIAGEIHLENTKGVASVTATLVGRLDITLGVVGGSEYALTTIVQPCWSTVDSVSCPSTLPFDITFPETFSGLDSEEQLPLPPSFDPAGDGFRIRDLYVRIIYRLTVRVAKGKWRPQKICLYRLAIDVKYAPRARPAQSTPSTYPTISRAINSIPEQWQQIGLNMPSKVPLEFASISCTLTVPAFRVFTKDENIPFHLRLTSSQPSMTALLHPEHSESRGSPRAQDKRPNIRVYIKRQVVANERGVSLARSYDIGEGTLRSSPPEIREDTWAGEAVIEYEGEVRCEQTITVGGFDMGKLRASDFMVLSIRPTERATFSAFVELVYAHPIRIVTG